VVTLLTDRDAAIPVLNARTQQRSAAFGGAEGDGSALELRFMAGNADVQVGDLLPLRASTASIRPDCRWPGWRDGGSPVGLGLRAHHAGADGGDGRRAPRAGAGAARVQLPPRPGSRAVDGCWHHQERQPCPAAPAGKGASRAMIMPRGSDQLLLPVNPFFMRSRC
jgi:hypothetical protein